LHDNASQKSAVLISFHHDNGRIYGVKIEDLKRIQKRIKKDNRNLTWERWRLAGSLRVA